MLHTKPYKMNSYISKLSILQIETDSASSQTEILSTATQDLLIKWQPHQISPFMMAADMAVWFFKSGSKH